MQSGSVGQFLTLQYTPPRPRYNFSRSEVIPAAITQSTRGRGGCLDQQPESHSIYTRSGLLKLRGILCVLRTSVKCSDS